ncbi:hypothetical protein [Oceanithermus sp.]
MRKLLPLLLLLAACTGTSEPPLDILLATGSGNQVVFYPSGPEEAESVGSWDVGEEVVDLLRPPGESRLWVLTPAHLLAFPLSGGSLKSAPDQTEAEFSFELETDCSQGRLRSGQEKLLLTCGGGNVWTVPLSAPQLQPLDTSGDDPATLYLLGPDDVVTRLVPGLNGFSIDYADSHFEVDSGQVASGLQAIWNDQTLEVALEGETQTLLYTWTAGSPDAPQQSGEPVALTGLSFIFNYGSGVVLGGDGGYIIRRPDKDDLKRTSPADYGLYTPNLYAYLAANGKLTVIDLLDPALTEHPRLFSEQPRGLVWLPVGE